MSAKYVVWDLSLEKVLGMAEQNKNMLFAAPVVAGTAEGAGGQHLAGSTAGLCCSCGGRGVKGWNCNGGRKR